MYSRIISGKVLICCLLTNLGNILCEWSISSFMVKQATQVLCVYHLFLTADGLHKMRRLLCFAAFILSLVLWLLPLPLDGFLPLKVQVLSIIYPHLSELLVGDWILSILIILFRSMGNVLFVLLINLHAWSRFLMLELEFQFYSSVDSLSSALYPCLQN